MMESLSILLGIVTIFRSRGALFLRGRTAGSARALSRLAIVTVAASICIVIRGLIVRCTALLLLGTGPIAVATRAARAAGTVVTTAAGTPAITFRFQVVILTGFYSALRRWGKFQPFFIRKCAW